MPQTSSLAIPRFLRLSPTLVFLLAVTPLSATGWHTNATQIVNPSGGTYAFSGVNWYGAETTAFTPSGLWAQDYKFILNEMKQNGFNTCLLYTSDAADERSSVDLGGRRIIK